MILTIKNKDNFLKNFLNPISRLDSSISLDLKETEVSTIVHNNSNIFLKATSRVETESYENRTLTLPDVIKLIKILSCIEQEDINLNIDTNCITYSDANNKFKYHLFDSSVVNNNTFNFDKIDEIDFNTNFTLTREKNNSILKALPFVTESSKLYLSTKDGNVYAELSDKKLHNVDSYTTLISEKYNGEEINQELILDIELFRLVSTLSFQDCTIYINSKFKMLKIEMNIDNCNLLFVSTSFKN